MLFIKGYVMTEVLGLQQKELPYFKRWFRHSEAQLFLWDINKIQDKQLFDYVCHIIVNYKRLAIHIYIGTTSFE